MTFSALDSELTGGLFAAGPMRAIFSARARLAAMIAVEAALAQAQAECGRAPDALAPAIAALGPDAFDLPALGAATALAGVPNIPFVKALQRLLPPDLEPHAHKGATTQDIEDSALALQMRDAFQTLKPDLVAALAALTRLARAHRETPCVGRTYGQHAAPTTFGAKVGVWGAGLADAATRFDDMQARACVLSLGGPVGTFAAMGADAGAIRAACARKLGLAAPPFTQHTARGRMAETGFFLAEMIGALAKMATDIIHLASTEVGECAEPFTPGRGGSSAMPHKRNPVSCTIILAAHEAAPGLAATLLAAMAAQHERPAGAWHGEWLALPQLFGLASGALREARALSGGLVVDAARMRANLDLTRGLLFSDALVGALAPFVGRTQAYGLVERAAAETRARGAHLSDLAATFVSDPAQRAAWRAAFDLAPGVAAGARAADEACAFVDACLQRLQEGSAHDAV